MTLLTECCTGGDEDGTAEVEGAVTVDWVAETGAVGDEDCTAEVAGPVAVNWVAEMGAGGEGRRVVEQTDTFAGGMLEIVL